MLSFQIGLHFTKGRQIHCAHLHLLRNFGYIPQQPRRLNAAMSGATGVFVFFDQPLIGVTIAKLLREFDRLGPKDELKYFAGGGALKFYKFRHAAVDLIQSHRAPQSAKFQAQ